jgi:hypothetical protein
MKSRHTLLPALALLALALFARADDLQVKGAGVKQVVVADAAPFTVSAPPNALLYFWTFPAGVTATDKGDSLEVTAAPKGTHSFTCKAITVDWTAKKATTAIHGVTVYVGTGPAPGPTPDPGPSPDFSAALKAAYDGQPNPAAVAPLASACRATAASVRGSSYPNWAGAFVDWDGKRPGKLPPVETAIWGEVLRRCPDAAPLTNPITPAGRVAAAEVFESAAKVLDGLAPPGPPPIPGTGLRVLFIEETANRTDLTPEQREILFGRGPGTVWDWLDQNCVKGPGGPERWLFDKDANPAITELANALKGPHPVLPAVVASNGRTGFDVPLGDMRPAQLIEKLKQLKEAGNGPAK